MTDYLLPDFNKYPDKLVPAIIQNYSSGKVLMLGYMNEEALRLTQQKGRVVFYSRSKGRLWEKGESSNNFLEVISLCLDCDSDSILIQAKPAGPTCHTGAESCFASDTGFSLGILSELEQLILDRQNKPNTESYCCKLLSERINRAAQKVGEEGVEVAISAVAADKQEFLNESADLIFHLLILLRKRDVCLSEVLEVLKNRRR